MDVRRRRARAALGALAAPVTELHYFNSLTIDLFEFKWRTQVRTVNNRYSIIPGGDEKEFA